ncbi:MAG: hypothetical protein GW760_00495 [Legionella sp.]|jgi:hypothetical protein|nr:hypothetical protein [Legionella sp.]
MAHVEIIDKTLFDKSVLDKLEQEIKTVLDIGAGIYPKTFIKPQLYICVEPFHEYVQELNKNIGMQNDQLFVVLNGDWDFAVSQFGENSVDTVFLIDVIEHLDKEEGVRLLALTEKIARKQVVIFTPLGFIAQETLHGGKDAWGLNGAAWQEHKSGWMPEDFDDSWDVYVCEDYHSHNNVNQLLDKPIGAIWAIKNKLESDKEPDESWLNNNEITKQIIERSANLFKANIETTKAFEKVIQAKDQEISLLKEQHRRLANTKAVRFANKINQVIGRA